MPDEFVAEKPRCQRTYQSGSHQRLRELSCEYAQGFFFSLPLPASEIPNFIAMTYAQ